MTVTLLNPGTTPVTYTDDARVIAAGEKIHGVTLDHTGQAAVDHGYLIAIAEQPVEDEKDSDTAADDATATGTAESGSGQADQPAPAATDSSPSVSEQA